MKSQKRSVMSRLKSCLCVFLCSSTFAIKVLNKDFLTMILNSVPHPLFLPFFGERRSDEKIQSSTLEIRSTRVNIDLNLHLVESTLFYAWKTPMLQINMYTLMSNGLNKFRKPIFPFLNCSLSNFLRLKSIMNCIAMRYKHHTCIASYMRSISVSHTCSQKCTIFICIISVGLLEMSVM